MLYDRFPFDRSLADDPISVVRPLAPDARRGEIAGIFASTLAIGNTTAIRGAITRLAELAGGDFGGFIMDVPSEERARRLRGFQHRWIRGDQLAFLADRLNATYSAGETLESVFAEGMHANGFAAGLDALARRLRERALPRGARPPRGYRQLFPSPLDSSRSPAKRLTLFVRWMTRTGYPDLGYWNSIPTGELRVPLDQHVHWIAYNLGLTQRRTRSWAAVEEVTDALRRIDPFDPVKYDFVLCHTGISGDCPKERDLSVCGPCAVRPDCRLWHGRRSVAR